MLRKLRPRHHEVDLKQLYLKRHYRKKPQYSQISNNLALIALIKQSHKHLLNSFHLSVKR